MLQDVPSNDVRPDTRITSSLVNYETPINRNKDSRKLFSSRIPNNALMWALIDDRKVEHESNKDSDHDLAVSYIDGWRPGPWKGQIWSPDPQDVNRVWTKHSIPLIWSGGEWLPYTASIEKDEGLVHPSSSQASVRQVEAVKYMSPSREGRPPAITKEDLNAAYVSFSLDPSREEELKIVIYAYVRGSFMPRQVGKLLRGKHEVATEEEDVILEFVAYLLGRLPRYTHFGIMENWITRSWARFFFPSQQRKVIDYTNKTVWMNEVDKGDLSYKHLHRCVSLLECSADIAGWDDLTEIGRFSKELLSPDPNSPWFQLSASSKEMLQARLRGESNKQTAKRLGYTPQHVGRLLNAAIEEAKQINEKSVKDDGGLECN